VNHNDDSDPNMLAHYLHICYTDLEVLLRKIDLFYMAGGIVKVNCLAMSAFFKDIVNVEYTHQKIAYDGVNRVSYHVVRIGTYSSNLGTFTFSEQLEMADEGLISSKKPHLNDQHRILRDYLHALLCEEIEARPSMVMPSASEFHTPEAASRLEAEPLAEIQPQALFDTPTQEIVGAKCIVESVDMQQFPLLSKLNIKFSTDFYPRALQRELDRLGEVIESVDLANMISTNDKVRARILVPKTGSWKSFSRMMKKTNWLFKAVDSVLPTSTENGELDEFDDEKGHDSSDVIEWFIRILGDKDPDAFLRAAQKLGVPVVAAKLSPEELIAMADEGNFGHATERVIWRFLSTKGIHVLLSDRMMWKLGDKAIKPMTMKVKLEETEYIMSHCPLGEVVSAELHLLAVILSYTIDSRGNFHYDVSPHSCIIGSL